MLPRQLADIDNSKYVLLGDSDAALRPHSTASGTSKASVEAQLLQTLCTPRDATWKQVCWQYHEQRYADASAKVELGKRLGQAQVLETPPWKKIEPEDFVKWMKAQLSGTKIFYVDDKC